MADQEVDILVRLREHARFMREAARERRAIAGYGDAAKKSQSQVGSMQRSFRSAGGVVGDFFQRLKFMFSVGAVGAFAVGADAALSFEDSMAKVLAITDVGPDQFKALGEGAKQLGADTRFSATEAANAMYFLAAAGTDANDLVTTLAGTLDLAAASGYDVAESAKLQTTILSGWSDEGETAASVADKLTVATNESKVQMDDLAYSMKFVVAMGGLAGQSLDETLAAIMALAQGGQIGSQAGTGLATGMTKLLAPGKKATQMLRKMGIETSELTGPNGLKPLSEVQEILRTGLEQLEPAQRAVALSTIFGLNAMDAWGVLLQDNAPVLKDYTALLGDAGGEAKRQADVMNNTTRGALERLKGSWESLAITFHERYDRDIKFAINKATDLIDDFRMNGTEAFGDYKDEVDQFAQGITDLWDVIENDFIPVWKDLYDVIDDVWTPLDAFTDSVEFLKDHPFFTRNFFVPAITGFVLIKFAVWALDRAIIGLLIRIAILGLAWAAGFAVGLIIAFPLIALILLIVAALILAWIYVDEFRYALINIYNWLTGTWAGRAFMLLTAPFFGLIYLILLSIRYWDQLNTAFSTVVGEPFMWIYDKFAEVIAKIMELWNSTVGNLEFEILGVGVNIPEMAVAGAVPFGAVVNEIRGGPISDIVRQAGPGAYDWLTRNPDEAGTRDDYGPHPLAGLYNPTVDVNVYLDGKQITDAVTETIEDRRARGFSRSGGLRRG